MTTPRFLLATPHGMPRVIGIDPGTLSIDLCGLTDGALFLDRTLPTAEALADPAALVALLAEAGPVDLIAGPSGYGLPLTPASEASEDALRLAYLSAEGERGGIGGLRALARALAGSRLPVVFTPGVIHLASVPAHRKVNRVDMGTADKVCAAALGVAQQARRRACDESEVSFILLELGGAFTAALAVDRGRIVDGVGGTSGPLGLRAAGALDGEVAYLAGEVSKSMLFAGGAVAVRGNDDVTPERFAEPRTPRERLAWDAYIEGALKAVAALMVSVPSPHEIVLSGRMARVDGVRRALAARLGASVCVLAGFAAVAKQAAQGAAILADGLAGGTYRRLADVLGVRDAAGTALDHLWFVSPDAARRRLGLA